MLPKSEKFISSQLLKFCRIWSSFYGTPCTYIQKGVEKWRIFAKIGYLWNFFQKISTIASKSKKKKRLLKLPEWRKNGYSSNISLGFYSDDLSFLSRNVYKTVQFTNFSDAHGLWVLSLPLSFIHENLFPLFIRQMKGERCRLRRHKAEKLRWCEIFPYTRLCLYGW